jgi:ribosomal protein S27AE
MTERKPYNKYVPIPEGEKLKPCPICGSNAILEEHHSHQWNPCLKVYRVCCPRCSLATEHYGKTADAIEAWTRMAGEKMKNDEDKLEKVKNLSWIDGKLDMVVRMVDDIQTDEANYKCLDETQRTRLTNLWNEAVDTMLSVGISLEELQKEGKA